MAWNAPELDEFRQAPPQRRCGEQELGFVVSRLEVLVDSGQADAGWCGRMKVKEKVISHDSFPPGGGFHS